MTPYRWCKFTHERAAERDLLLPLWEECRFSNWKSWKLQKNRLKKMHNEYFITFQGQEDVTGLNVAFVNLWSILYTGHHLTEGFHHTTFRHRFSCVLHLWWFPGSFSLNLCLFGYTCNYLTERKPSTLPPGFIPVEINLPCALPSTYDPAH